MKLFDVDIAQYWILRLFVSKPMFPNITKPCSGIITNKSCNSLNVQMVLICLACFSDLAIVCEKSGSSLEDLSHPMSNTTLFQQLKQLFITTYDTAPLAGSLIAAIISARLYYSFSYSQGFHSISTNLSPFLEFV